MAYTFNTKIEEQDIIVYVIRNGIFVGNRAYSSALWTEASSLTDMEYDINNYGWLDEESGLWYEPEPPEPSEEVDTVGAFDENSESITSKNSQLNSAISVGNPATSNVDIIKESYLSEDDALAKMIIAQSSSIPEDRISEDEAKKIVKSYPKNHPAKTFIKEKQKEINHSVEQISIKGVEIAKGGVQLSTETIAAFITIGSSAAIMPLGAGLPTAFSAVQGLFASLKAFQTKINQIQPLLEPLKYVAMLVPEGSEAISMINISLNTLNTAISASSLVISPITQVQSMLSGAKIPGVGGPENPTPAESIDIPVLMWGNNGAEVEPGTDVWITSNAKGGTWLYKYWWTSDNDPAVINRSTNAVSVNPTTTTKYSVGVSNKDGTGETAWGSWTVTVKP